MAAPAEKPVTKVTPDPLLAVVSGAIRLSALGAREATSLGKGDVDVQPPAGPVEGATVDLPGGLQKEGLLPQLGVLHRFLSSLLFGDTRYAAAGCLVFYPAGGKEWKQDMLPQAVWRLPTEDSEEPEIATRIASKDGKRSFLELAHEEEKHRQTLSEWFLRETGKSYEVDPTEVRPLFHFPEEAVLSQSTALEALSVGIQMERDSVEFYTSFRLQVEDEAGKSLLAGLIAFEEGHFLKLQREYDQVL
ncbi:MAG: ferritin family protein, partial [Coprothermobacterota bacterium]|nr:ferritin family protein [Coprothermobacterota bacterium]